MASSLRESVGQTVGYRMRLDTQVSKSTRIEVVTEGVLTRMLQSDPSLEGVAAVIFDEFHERSLQADLGLALALDARDNLAPDLKLMMMSATLDGERVAALLGDAPMVQCAGAHVPGRNAVRGEECAAAAGCDRAEGHAGVSGAGRCADCVGARSMKSRAMCWCSCRGRARSGACRR